VTIAVLHDDYCCNHFGKDHTVYFWRKSLQHCSSFSDRQIRYQSTQDHTGHVSLPAREASLCSPTWRHTAFNIQVAQMWLRKRR